MAEADDAAPELAVAARAARALWPVVESLREGMASCDPWLRTAQPLWAEGTTSPTEVDRRRDVAMALACGLATARAAALLAGESRFDADIARAHVPLSEVPLGRLVMVALGEDRCEALLRPLAELLLTPRACAHVYDALLKRADSRLVKKRGVYYTPHAVARTLVDRVDASLVQLGYGEGVLALGPQRALVDPATGTGVFLCEVIERAFERARAAAGSGAAVGDKMRSVVTGLRGYELLPLPRALCQMQVALQLARCGGEAAEALALQLSGRSFLSLAADAPAGDVLCVLGNPPYRRGADAPAPPLRELLRDYRKGLDDERNLQPLSDDYIAFIRVAEHLLSARDDGVLAMVTNHAYLRGRLHRGMRANLKRCFPRIEVLDLHGSVRVRQAGAARDGNVFGIGQGVCIAHMVRGLPNDAPGAGVFFAELRGSRDSKLSRLAGARVPASSVVESPPPYHPLSPVDPIPAEYGGFLSLPSLFDFHSVGAKPGDDGLLVGFDGALLLDGLEQRRRALAADGGGRRTEAMRRLARRDPALPFEPAHVIEYAYRPFDTRCAYYDASIWTRALTRLRTAMAAGPALLTTRIVKDSAFDHVLATRELPDVIALSSTSSVNAYAFPRATLAAAPLLSQLPGAGDDDSAFAYLYAILHSPAYRVRYLPALRNDFPRIPVARSRSLVDALVDAGRRLLELHLGQGDGPGPGAVRFHDGGDRALRRVGERGRGLLQTPSGEHRLRINDVSYFGPIAPAVWQARVGAYQVAHKWLDDRRRARRALGHPDVARYLDVLARLAQTLLLQRGIDEAVDRHGGWPDAFA